MDPLTCSLLLSSKTFDASPSSISRVEYSFCFALRQVLASGKSLSRPLGLVGGGESLSVSGNEREQSLQDFVSWSQCLRVTNEDILVYFGDTLLLYLFQIGTFIQHLQYKDFDHGEITSPLIDFLRLTHNKRLLNTYLLKEDSNSKSFQPNEADWMALVTFLKYNILDHSMPLYEKLLEVCIFGQGLNGVLQMTGEKWDNRMGLPIRRKIQNIMFILNRLYALSNIPSETLEEEEDEGLKLMDNHQFPTSGKVSIPLLAPHEDLLNALLEISIRLERGVIAEEADDGMEDARPNYFSSSEEEDDEEEIDINGFAEKKSQSKKSDGVESDPDIEYGGANSRLKMIRKFREAEENLPRYRSSWIQLCMTAVLGLHNRLVGFPNYSNVFDASTTTSCFRMALENLSSTVSMLASPCWQRQSLALYIVKDLLDKSRQKLENASNTKKSGSKKLTKGRSSSKEESDKRGLSSSKVTVGGKDKSGSAKSRDTGNTIGGENNSNRSTKATMKNTNSGISRRKSTSASNNVMRPLEELCRSGHMRQLVWCLMHKRGLVRLAAADTLQCILELSYHQESMVDLWACFVEQGLVPLLELIQHGITIRHETSPSISTISESNDVTEKTAHRVDVDAAMERFPEASVRECVRSLLDTLALKLQTNEMLRVRISSALIHSGNPKLRLNIFAGLQHISGQSDFAGASLWHMISPSQQQRKDATIEEDGSGEQPIQKGNGVVFLAMLRSLLKDSGELRDILSLVSQLFNDAHRSRMENEKRKRGGSAQSSEKKVSSSPMGGSRKEKLTGGPTVMVSDKGHLVKMACPAMAVVRHHSLYLAAYLDEVQAKNAISENTDTEMEMLMLGKERSHATIFGSYGLWQEIFSHMVDESLLNTSLSRMPCDEIIDAYYIAKRYQMLYLLNIYADAIGKRINGDTVVAALQCALGKEPEDFSGKSNSEEEETNMPPTPAPISTKREDQGDEDVQTLSSLPSVDAVIGKQKPKSLKHVHFELSCICLQFVVKHADVLFDRKRPLRMSELVGLIHEACRIIMTY